MANVLNDSDNWSGAGDGDIIQWNPETQRYEDTYFLGHTVMRYNGEVLPGDVVHGTFLVGYIGEVAEGNSVEIIFTDQGTGTNLFATAILPNTPTVLSFPAATNAVLSITDWNYFNTYPMAFITPYAEPGPPDRWVRVRVSRDGGHNWGNWRQMSLGQLGEYQDRVSVAMRRWGVARQFCFDIEVSSPIKASLLAAYADYEQLGS